MQKIKRKRKLKDPNNTNYVDNKKFLEEIIKYKKLIKKNKGVKVPVPEELAKFFLLIAQNRASSFNFSNYCVDQETEALTKRGWVKYDNITIDDIILSLDPKTKKLVWSSIRNLYMDYYDGLMFRLIGKTLDALVTPGHKFLTNRGILSIEDIHTKDHFITMGEAIDDVTEKSYSDAFVEIVGWFVTEGTIVKYFRKRDNEYSYYLRLFQKKGTEKHQRIIESFIKLSENKKTEWKEFNFKNNNDVSCFSLYGDLSKEVIKVAQDRVLSIDFILKLTLKQRRLLIKTMIDGDGSKTPYGFQYSQKDDVHIQSFLYLCTLAGITTHAKKKWYKTPFGESEYWVITLSEKKQCYSEKTDFHGARRTSGGHWNAKSKKKNIANVPYRGIVWCPQTDYGTFICKRGPRIYATGNSFKDELISEGILNCLQYAYNFDPKISQNPFCYFTQIISWAFVRKIKKEKKQLYIRYKTFLDSSMSDDKEILTHLQENDTLIDQKREFVENFEKSLLDKKKIVKKKNKTFDDVLNKDKDVATKDKRRTSKKT